MLLSETGRDFGGHRNVERLRRGGKRLLVVELAGLVACTHCDPVVSSNDALQSPTLLISEMPRFYDIGNAMRMPARPVRPM